MSLRGLDRTLRPAIAAAFGVLFALALAAPALAAPVVTLNVVAPNDVVAGQPVGYSIGYTIAGDDLETVEIVADLPIGLVAAEDSVPLGITGGCLVDDADPFHTVCTWQFTASGGTSGQLLVTAVAARFVHDNGAQLTIDVTLDGQYDDNGTLTPITQLTSSDSTTVAAEADVLLGDTIGTSQWIENPTTGELGLAFWYHLDLENHGTAALEPGFAITDTLPSALVLVEYDAPGYGG